MSAVRACVIGSTNVDVVLHVPVLPAPGETVLAGPRRREAGGKGANQAVALARLGANVSFGSAVGADEDGRWSLEQLRAEGVDTTGVAALDGVPTGLAVVVVDAAGENLIVVTAGANAHVVAPPAVDADVLLLSLEIPMAVVCESAARARLSGVPVVLNAAPATALPAELLQQVTVLVLNEHELTGLGGQPGDLLARGPGTVVVTRGAAGAGVVDARGSRTVPAPRADAVDTTGAGDCFSAAVALGVGRGWDIARSVELAVRAAALSVAAPGARGGFPTAGELQLQ